MGALEEEEGASRHRVVATQQVNPDQKWRWYATAGGAGRVREGQALQVAAVWETQGLAALEAWVVAFWEV